MESFPDQHRELMARTDEAFFVSSDGLVEFYVHSPLWEGNPEYTRAASNETLSNEKIDEAECSGSVWRTFRADDGSYLRSVNYIRKSTVQDCTTSGTSYESTTFGIKYANEEAYNQYIDKYRVFKDSLVKYSD